MRASIAPRGLGVSSALSVLPVNFFLVTRALSHLPSLRPVPRRKSPMARGGVVA